MKKRVMCFIGIMVVLCLALTACGSKESNEQPADKAANESQQEEIPAIDAPVQEDEPESTTTPIPTPVPTKEPQKVKVGRLLLGLGGYMREYGSIEMDLGLTTTLNLTDAEIEELKNTGAFEEIEIGSDISMKAKGMFGCNKQAAGIELKIDMNQFGAVMHQDRAQYFYLSESGDVLDYYYDSYTGTWYQYNEGEMEIPDLTELVGIIDAINLKDLALEQVYQELVMTEDMDKYLVDGIISFDRFLLMASVANVFIPEIMNSLPDDLEIKVHMEFDQETLAIRVLSIYLDNIRPMTQTDRVQFSELYIDMKFDITPDGAKVVIPGEALDHAIVME